MPVKMTEGSPWRNRDVWAISMSAFFADLGYQTVQAGFPLFLVLTLHQPVWEYGLASAISYGGGAVFSYLGARLGDRIGHRRLALSGNSAIPLLSFCALVSNPAWAIGMLSGGWWARNLRSPSRRVMLVEAVPDERRRSDAFGFLHALDVGGGALAGGYLLLAVDHHVAFRWIFVATAIPLILSTLSLSRTTTGRAVPSQRPARSSAEGANPPGARNLLAAAALYGFTFYSAGFPVLTLAQSSGHLSYGVGAFLVLQLASAATGYLLGGRLGRAPAAQLLRLGLFGYGAAGLGAALLAISYGDHLPSVVAFLSVALIGFALGIVETLEPAAMSLIRPGNMTGRGMGALSAARSVGTFSANLVMGLLYALSASLAYGYAAILAATAAVVVLGAVPGLRRWQTGSSPDVQ